ncbi:MAG TPA: polysaccharide deacetylase family protein [Trueperaceae bacterium]|nr:polysaccharide deacetylase family protein [Trueperaceae bacterium]
MKVRFRIFLLIVLSVILILLQFTLNKKNLVENSVQASSLTLVKPIVEIDYARAQEEVQVQKQQASPEDFALYKGYYNYLASIPQELKDYFHFKANTTDKIVVLSFDDGPLAYTPSLMEVLSQSNTPATFFLLCNRITNTNSQWYSNPLFSYGMHTLSHKDYSYLDFEQTKQEIDKCQEIFAANNLLSQFFRPAFGIITPELVDVLKTNQIIGVLWNIDSLDWDKKRGDELVAQVLDNLSPGSIVLFHDGVNQTDLKRIIAGISEQGYRIVSLEELLEYPKLNSIY